VEIICPEHGFFSQTPLSHLRGSGCPKCGIEKMKKSLKKPNDLFINECIEIHNNLYDYSKVSYNKLSDSIIIICKYHGEFKQRAFSHKQGYGCIKCNKSKGELKIENFLKERNIYYEYNKKFDTCKNKNILSFDFYIPNYNLCLEYDGIQHHESIDFFGGDVKLRYQKKLDNIKNKWCVDNKIDLLRISYKDFLNIENILEEKIYNIKK
jgi:very-short-patch-repair endonuclease